MIFSSANLTIGGTSSGGTVTGELILLLAWDDCGMEVKTSSTSLVDMSATVKD